MSWDHCWIASVVLYAVIPNTHAVSAHGAAAVVAPSGLDAEISFDGKSVFLSWIDNSDDETGFVVERACSSGSFLQIAAKATNVSVCTDTNPPPCFVSWRVKAVRNSESSSYCTPVSMTITGQPAFAVTSPKAGDSVVNDGMLNIRWFIGNGVAINSVLIMLSIDGGLSWEYIYPGNAIERGTPDWGDWSWDIPAGMVSDSAIVRVHEYGDYSRGVSSGVFLIVNKTASVRNRVLARNTSFRIAQAGTDVLLYLPKNVPGKVHMDITDTKGARIFSCTAISGVTVAWASGSVSVGRYIARMTSNNVTTPISFVVAR